MLIASWNVNSIKARLPLVVDWLKTQKPDILLLQEIKTTAENFPYAAFTEAGYESVVHGQKSYNGVAILSKFPLQGVTKTLPIYDESYFRNIPDQQDFTPEVGPDSLHTDAQSSRSQAQLTLDLATQGDIHFPEEQARFLQVEAAGIIIIDVYVPNGNPVHDNMTTSFSEKFVYKQKWLARLEVYLRELWFTRRPFIIGGDFNIIPERKDCYDPSAWQDDALFIMPMRQLFRRLCHLGLSDVFRACHPEEISYSFWDYQRRAWPLNHGIRIDHFLASPEIMDRLEDCWIDSEPRGREKASDHTPILMRFMPPI